MKCHYCGTEAAGKEVFCRFCGTRLESTSAEEKTAVPAQTAVEEAAFAWQPYQSQTEEPAAEVDEFGVVPFEEVFRPAPAAVKAPERREPPRNQLPTGRSLVKMVFLGILTLGIYPTVIWSRIVTELNLAASRYDGQRTMPYFGMVLLMPITLGIFPLVWMHRFCNRIGTELRRRNLNYKFSASTFWLWNVLGSLILVGPFVFLHKLMKTMDLINSHYNVNG